MQPPRRTLSVLMTLACIAATLWIGALSGSGPGSPGSAWASSPRLAGETIADATGIPSMPFRGGGSTAGYNDDYDCNCSSFFDLRDVSNSPDRVYSYAPSTDEAVTVDLCTASYDTKVYIYDEQLNVVACNDNSGCTTRGLQSRIESVVLPSRDQFYYIVVDGSNGEAGPYEINLALTACPVECPPGALQEAEPPCSDAYLDQHNAGCVSVPPTFQKIEGQNGTSAATLCAKSCAFPGGGGPERDEDWFEITAVGGIVTVAVTPECPVRLGVFAGDCSSLQLVQETTIRNCERVSLDFTAPSGGVYRLLVTPAGGDERPEFGYLLELGGIRPAPPAYGACCFRNAACRLLDRARCDLLRGVYGGDGTLCSPNPCRMRGTEVPDLPGSENPGGRASWGQIKTLYR